MYKKKLENDVHCPLEYGLELFGGKWDARIICVLGSLKRLRYSELRAEMADITDAVLASALKKLVASGVVAREQYNEIPPRVEYTLTDRGRSAVPILRSICKWSGSFYKDNSDHHLKKCQCCDYVPFEEDETA